MSTLTVQRFRVTYPLYLLGTWYLRLSGWTVEGKVPSDTKWIGIVAPHTSNWDFVYMLAVSFHLRVPAYWIGKHSLFRFPFGWIMSRLGGIPVDRQAARNYVEQVVQAFNERNELVLGITPEGTRKRVARWKSGFYYIARRAGVPVVLISIDYPRRVVTIAPAMTLSGDIKTDTEKIREFYADVQPKYPDKKGNIEIARAGKLLR